jgi:hypothetical protein
MLEEFDVISAPQTSEMAMAAPGILDRFNTRRGRNANRRRQTGTSSALRQPGHRTLRGCESDEGSWWMRLKCWLRSRSARGFVVSIVFHLLLLLALSFIMIYSRAEEEPLLTVFHAEEQMEFEFGYVTIDPRNDLAKIQTNPNTQPQLHAGSPPSLEIPAPKIPADERSDVAGKAEAGASDNAGGGLTQKGANAVSQGSFTVWTVPEDPEPGQNYTIIIQIKLPKKVRRYPTRDLSGIVIGSDLWRQPIPGNAPKYLRVVNHRTQLQVRVPGAARHVQDTIRIRSRILKEKQTLQILF